MRYKCIRSLSSLICALFLLQLAAYGQTFNPNVDRTVDEGNSEITGLEGQSVTFGFVVTDVIGPQYRWQRFTNAEGNDDLADDDNWETIITEADHTGIWTNELTITALSEDPDGTEGFYRLRVRGHNVDEWTSSPLVEVRTRPAAITWDPEDDDEITVTVGQALELEFEVDYGGDEVQFRWQKWNVADSEWEVVRSISWEDLLAIYDPEDLDPNEVPDTVVIDYEVASAALADAGVYRLQASVVEDQWESSPEITVTVNQYNITVNPATTTLRNNNGGNAPVAFGQSLTIGYTVTRSGAAITGTTYQWQKYNGSWVNIEDANALTYAITNAQLSHNGSYRLKVIPPAGQGSPEVAGDEIPVRVNPRIATQPTPALTTIRIGETFSVRAVPFAGQGSLSYIWYHSRVESSPAESDWVTVSGQITEVLVVSNAQLSSSGLYRVRIINAIGNDVYSNTVRLVVNPPNMAPNFTQQPQAVTVRAWQTIELSGLAAGFPNPTYQWQRQNASGNFVNVTNSPGKVSGARTNSLTINFAIPTDAGTYRLRATNSQGSADSEEVVVAVQHAPIITTQPADARAAKDDDPIELTVVAEGVPDAFTYAWQKWDGADWTPLDGDDAFVTGFNSATLTIETDNAAAASGRYRVLVSNDAGSILSREANVTVTATEAGGGDTAPVFLRQPQDAVAQLGGWAIFSAQVVGNPVPTLQWEFNNEDGGGFAALPGATSAELILSELTADDAGLYRLKANNVEGDVFSAEVRLTVVAGSARWDTAVEIGETGWFYFRGVDEDPENFDPSPGWFDLFYKTDADPDTIFHATHGWLFVSGEDPYDLPGLWFWSSDLGWFNTWKGIYPIIYFADYGWFEYLEYTVNPRWFFDITNSYWVDEDSIGLPPPAPEDEDD